MLSIFEILLQTMETFLEGCEFGCGCKCLSVRGQMPVVVLANAVRRLFLRLTFLLGVELFQAECPGPGIVEACEFGCSGKCLRVRESWRQTPCIVTVEADAFGCGGKYLGVRG